MQKFATTVRCQAFCYSSIIMILLIGCFSIIYHLNILLISNIFHTNFQEMYIEQSSKQFNIQLLHYESAVVNLFNISNIIKYKDFNQLIVLQQLYFTLYPKLLIQPNITLNQDAQFLYGGIQTPPKSLLYDTFRTRSFACYTNKTNLTYPLNHISLLYMKMQESLFDFAQIFDPVQITKLLNYYYAFTDEPQVFATYPCAGLGNSIYGLNVSSRPWFIKGKALYNDNKFEKYDYAFSDPFLAFSKDHIEVTTVMPIIDQQLNFKGVVASDFVTDFSHLFVKSNQKVSMLLFVTRQGIILSSGYNISFSKFPCYMYNQAITGFNYNDWVAIVSTQVSNCDDYMTRNNMVCRYNSIFDTQVFINLRYIKQFNYYLIMLSDDIQYRFQQNAQITEMTNQFQYQYLYEVSVFTGICLFLSLLSYYMLYRLSQPLIIINDHCRRLFSNYSFKSQKYKSYFKDKSLQIRRQKQYYKHLFSAYYNFLKVALSTTLSSKNSECLYYEDLVFPMRIQTKSRKQLLAHIITNYIFIQDSQ